MELPNLIHKVLVKVAPTTATENEKISQDCKLWYEKLTAKIAEKKANNQPLSLIDKLIDQLDSWYMRLLVAMSYFFIIKMVQDIINPSDPDDDDMPK